MQYVRLEAVMLRPRYENFGLGLEHLASKNVLSNPEFRGQTLQYELQSGTVYAVKLTEQKDIVRHSNVEI